MHLSLYLSQLVCIGLVWPYYGSVFPFNCKNNVSVDGRSSPIRTFARGRSHSTVWKTEDIFIRENYPWWKLSNIHYSPLIQLIQLSDLKNQANWIESWLVRTSPVLMSWLSTQMLLVSYAQKYCTKQILKFGWRWTLGLGFES